MKPTLSTSQLGIMTDNNSTSCDEPVNNSAHIFFIVIYSFIFLVGLFLNSFTLRVYFCSAQPLASSSVTIYLKNLAASDFLISLCLPLRILNYASKTSFIRQTYCSFGASAFYLNMYASILFMGYIAANRYLKIVYPVGNHALQTPQTAYIVSTVTWGLLLVMTSTYMILSLLTQDTRDDLPGMVSCDVLHSKKLHLFYKVIHSCSLVIFLLVLMSLIFFYSTTSRRLLLAQRNQPASSNSKKLTKSRRNMLVLVSVFCICFVPYHLVRLPYAFIKTLLCSSRWWFFYLKELTIVMSVLNVCLDPLIYFIFCKAFRAQISLGRFFSTTQVPSQVTTEQRRGSKERRTSIKNLRKLSLTPNSNQTTVL
ncbi:P2Y purinoceptor 14 [Austrofundulus limnaeus]|uniref:P2Y purinoceptor 14 n=1 Tax=Austrofundulus limnaeus TaxID=52670 RepID=A0A2I4CYX8_AUSLI|nr:PREDICTED: P2Y purinoceptor 14-like [Austrofundulus limnaeus]